MFLRPKSLFWATVTVWIHLQIQNTGTRITRIEQIFIDLKLKRTLPVL
jgi:hypothetical protein